VDDNKQATRLLALAMAARERGDFQAADELMNLALESMDRGQDMPPPPIPAQVEQPVPQQQQQAQAKRKEE
jgi:hypothetical protein